MESPKEQSIVVVNNNKAVAFVHQRWKTILIVALIAGVGVYIAVDTSSQSCILEEKNNIRLNRLFCDETITEEEARNASLPVSCQDKEVEQEWRLSDDGSKCIQNASCYSVAVDSFLQWISNNPGIGFVVISIVYAIASVLLVPGSLLTLGAGASFATALGLGGGVLVGTIAVVLGATVGATAAFVLGRYLLSDMVAKWAEKHKVMKAIDAALEESGFQVVLLLRLSPIVPYNIFNYIMGSTSCTLRNYVLATVLGIIPGTTAYVYIGATIATAVSGGESGDSDNFSNQCDDGSGLESAALVTYIAGPILAIAGIVLIVYYSKKKLNEILEAEKEKEGQLET